MTQCAGPLTFGSAAAPLNSKPLRGTCISTRHRYGRGHLNPSQKYQQGM